MAGLVLAPHELVKIILLSDEAIRLEAEPGPMTIEALEPDQQYSPFHMLASSLAYCTFSVMYSWATHTHQNGDDIAIEVRWKFSEDEPLRVSEMHLEFDWPGLPEKKLEAAKRVAAMCTIHATLHDPPRVTTEPMSRSRAVPDENVTADASMAGAHVPSPPAAP